MPIIGRDRALVDAFAETLHAATRSRHDYSPLRETERGVTFEAMLLVQGAPSGHVVRVTVELDRVLSSSARERLS
jgi:hypothetical protein